MAGGIVTGLDFGVIQRALPFLVEGLALSFFLTAVAMLGGIVLGLGLAMVRLSGWKVAAILAAGYVNGFRAIPLVLVIFWFYFLVPLALGRSVGALQSVIIAFVLFEAAYYSEIFRAGLQRSGPASGRQPMLPASVISRPCGLLFCPRRYATCCR